MTTRPDDDCAALYLSLTLEGVDFDDPRLQDLRARMTADDITRVQTGLFLNKVQTAEAADNAIAGAILAVVEWREGEA